MTKKPMAGMQQWKHNAKLNIVAKEYEIKAKKHGPSTPGNVGGRRNSDELNFSGVASNEVHELKAALVSLESKHDRLESRLDDILNIVKEIAARKNA
eukprot:CAMPEP_0196590434 /NCGR_PEP_ID=MMETSP1081-20130531/66637_1 /TAXON_ID=36882 /ORGANISM="Pyramimonas amylifera, Strain CCMP720" /LENGTH=96 /DNA_ID=CAMNT_0041913545 /DNA_START=15 /DNA_END=305 /DNA_ORIENTATION=-